MTHTEEGDIDYDKTTAVHPLTLIREVKKYEVLYNKQLLEYTDMVKKDQIWENIHQVLFPNYWQLSEETKATIKKTVRKRWKSLRDALVKDQRVRSDVTILKKAKRQNPLVREMQFLIPYIKTPRFKVRHQHPDSSDNFDDGSHSPDFCKLVAGTTIDLTTYPGEDADSIDDDMISSEALYPSVRLTTSESESGEVEWQNGVCVSTSVDVKPALSYTIQEMNAALQPPPPPPTQSTEAEPRNLKQEPDQSFITEFQSPLNPRKRKRLDSNSELEVKIVELVERCNSESQDEDRMFLLSLLSDFKRVPVNKKLKVKSAFVKALSEALD